MIYRSRDPEVPVLGAFLRECVEAGREGGYPTACSGSATCLMPIWRGAPGAASPRTGSSCARSAWRCRGAWGSARRCDRIPEDDVW